MPRFQPRLKQGSTPRQALGSTVLHRIREAVRLEAERFDCSRSFVVATILGRHFGVDEQVDYAEPTPVHRHRVVGVRRRK